MIGAASRIGAACRLDLLGEDRLIVLRVALLLTFLARVMEDRIRRIVM